MDSDRGGILCRSRSRLQLFRRIQPSDSTIWPVPAPFPDRNWNAPNCNMSQRPKKRRSRTPCISDTPDTRIPPSLPFPKIKLFAQGEDIVPEAAAAALSANWDLWAQDISKAVDANFIMEPSRVTAEHRLLKGNEALDVDFAAENEKDDEAIHVDSAAEKMEEWELERNRTWELAVKICLDNMPEWDRQEWLRERREEEDLERARAAYATSLVPFEDYSASFKGAPCYVDV
ncbi:hypothetical protein MSAN_00133300 [Mycena sanguinolenta]|uniref:Uncharacterized protein n=1 Tax=Mycena sanguinolenta TaxID=230812 RepID=A0A8H6Z7C4_9AGAR|nr:hypothetical protein MSAN_00576600 [Mycena sanguinolenta]KAF7377142.1 hypothetical protein MSAN_00133300 [Mycena sanguinolenta]